MGEELCIFDIELLPEAKRDLMVIVVGVTKFVYNSHNIKPPMVRIVCIRTVEYSNEYPESLSGFAHGFDQTGPPSRIPGIGSFLNININVTD